VKTFVFIPFGVPIFWHDCSCLDLEEPKKRVTDEELRIEVKTKFNMEPIQIQNLHNDEQMNIVQWMKQLDGVSLRQIARITGLTVNKVFKA